MATILRTCTHGCPAYQDSNGKVHNNNHGQCPNNNNGNHNLQPIGLNSAETEANNVRFFGIIGACLAFGTVMASIFASLARLDGGSKFNFNYVNDWYSVATITIIVISTLFWLWVKFIPFFARKTGLCNGLIVPLNKLASCVQCVSIEKLRVPVLALCRRPIINSILIFLAYFGTEYIDSVIFIYSIIDVAMFLIELTILNDINLICCTAHTIQTLQQQVQHHIVAHGATYQSVSQQQD